MKDLDTMRVKIDRVKNSHDISELVKVPFIYQKLQSYMDFEQTSFEKDPSLGGQIPDKFNSKDVRAWRSLHNYIAVLNMIDQFRTDSYLKTTSYAKNLLPFMPSVDSFSKRFSRIQEISTARCVNRAAMLNIASYLGVKPSQLQKLTGTDHVVAVIYKG